MNESRVTRLGWMRSCRTHHSCSSIRPSLAPHKSPGGKEKVEMTLCLNFAGLCSLLSVASCAYRASAFVATSTALRHAALLELSELKAAQNGKVNGIASSAGKATQRLGSMTGPTVWTEFARIAQENHVASLDQGFPDWLPSLFAVDSLVEAALDSQESPHQYTRTAGHPNLVNQLAKRYTIHLKRQVDPMSQVTVTVGASQALYEYTSLQTLIQPDASCGDISTLLIETLLFHSHAAIPRRFRRRSHPFRALL
jgi:DNA-binding transcriptional MocR family regulator